MAAKSKANSKTENKTVAEKPTKDVSLKRLVEDEHRLGKHKAEGLAEIKSYAESQGDCGFCQRRVTREVK